MSKIILRSSCNDYQFFSADKDGRTNMASPSLVQFIYRLVRENAEFDADGAHLFTSSLDQIDRQIFLSHLIEADDYYNYCESPSLLKTAITEYEPEMQRLICEYQDDVWHSDMQQSGLNPYRHSDNGEIEYRL